MPPTKRLFLSYSRTDAALKAELMRHLEVLRSAGIAQGWDDGQIEPGADWRQVIEENIENSEVIILLISPDFLASSFCRDIEMTRSLARWQANDAKLAPILLRPCLWQDTPLARLQILPKGCVPVTSFADRDAAWTEIVASIRDSLRTRQHSRPIDAHFPSPTSIQVKRMLAEAPALSRWWRRVAVVRTYAPYLVGTIVLLLAAGLMALLVKPGPPKPLGCPHDMVLIGRGVVAFCIDRQPVAIDEYAACVAEKKCTAPKTVDECAEVWAGTGALPDNCVDAFQAATYCVTRGKHLTSGAELSQVELALPEQLPADISADLRISGIRCARGPVK